MNLTNRIYSIDVFRGITVAAMILVNNPGSWEHVYPPLLHAHWNGCTPTDLIFPFFLFIVGVSIHIAYEPRRDQGLTKEALRKILKRALIIFLLGIALTWYTIPVSNMFNAERLASMRIPGVLQRISLVFLVSAILYLTTNWLQQIRIAIAILLGYYVIMNFVPVPDTGHASLEPSDNLGAWLDRLIFGRHLWASSKTGDPEGVLSTLPAVATGILGMLTGKLFTTKAEAHQKLVWLFFTGAMLIFAGLAWGLAFPINKALWTSSYVLYAAGIAMQMLAVLHWLIDVQGFRSWSQPFVYYGTNAIFVFVASGFLAKTMGRIRFTTGEGREQSVWGWLFENGYGWMEPTFASFAFALTLVLVFLVILRAMYNRKIFIKV